MDIKTIGLNCKAFREKLGYLQTDVAKQLRCSKENISAFENGRNDSATIYDWYIQKGLYDDMKERLIDNGKGL